LPLVHVGAAAERPAPPAQDRDIRIRIRVGSAERRYQLMNHLIADRIQLLRPVQRDRRSMVAAFIHDVLPIRWIVHPVLHPVLPWSSLPLMLA
jgi:hypothetical protein